MPFYILIWLNLRRFFTPACLLWYLIQDRLPTATENIVLTTPVTTYTTTYQHAPHTIIYFYILIKFNIQQHFLCEPVTCVRKSVRDKRVKIYTTTSPHTSPIIVHFYIWQHIHTILVLFEIYYIKLDHLSLGKKQNRFKPKLQVPMEAYTFDVISFQQRNILFPLFSRDLETSIGNLFLRSHIPPLSHISYILFHATARVACCFFFVLCDYYHTR